MTRSSILPEEHVHGPENAEHELRKAYNVVMETGVVHFWDRHGMTGVNAQEVSLLYKRAYQSLRDGNRLAAERWARSAKHLGRAFWSEAKIAYLEAHSNDVPFLLGASAEEYHLHEKSDTTEDVLNSLQGHVPPGLAEIPREMSLYLSRARRHLESLHSDSPHHELLRAERIKTAHEYGRVVECMGLALEAEEPTRERPAA